MSISRSWLTAAGLGAALLAAGCSSSGGSGTSPGAGSATTVAIRNVSGTGHVLVDARGRTLYTSDQEKAAGKVLCSTSDCTAIWTPLTLDTGKQPSGPAGVTSQLSVVKRPDGTRQVA